MCKKQKKICFYMLTDNGLLLMDMLVYLHRIDIFFVFLEKTD